MIGMVKSGSDPHSGYREESPKFAIVITIAATLLLGGPLALANKKIEDDGSQAADVSKYAKLAKQVDDNVNLVREILHKGIVKEAVLADTVDPSGTTLITPPIAPTNLNEATKDPNELKINLSAIYWSPRDPLVTINDDNYHAGDKIKGTGFTILEIRKTEVVFRSPAGAKVVKYFYDYSN